MRDIAKHIVLGISEGLDLVLVTVVAVRGSAPRHVGSQMLVGGEGRVCGTIGGGAIEAHGIANACAMVGKTQPRMEDLALTQRGKNSLGMACGGDATLLYTPVCANDAAWGAVAAQLLRCMHGRIPARLALRYCASADEGVSACQNEANAALLDEQGVCLTGNVKVQDVPGLAAHVLEDSTPGVGTRAASAQGAFMGDWFVMPVPVAPRAVVFGAGHVGRATIEALSRVGFSCTAFDNRPEFAIAEEMPAAHEVVLGNYDDIAASISLDARDYVLIMTSGHASDISVLGQVAALPLAYVGMIGSRRKIATARKRLLEQGVSEAALNAVHMPIGIDIKAETPEEIAISIAAECILHRATH